MSEVKLNLIDSHETLHGTIHGSVADAAVAALSAEPETIAELQAALARYIKPRDEVSPFVTFCSTKVSLPSDGGGTNRTYLDLEPWDAGIMVIDLAARIVSCESTYSMPQPSGEVHYHDGRSSTDIPVLYRLPDDWLFVNSVEAYRWSRERRAGERLTKTPLDVREVLYGSPLLDFIVNECRNINLSNVAAPAEQAAQRTVADASEHAAAEDAVAEDATAEDAVAGDAAAGDAVAEDAGAEDGAAEEALAAEISNIHARWLMTPREDLLGQSPREVLLARQDFIDFDLHTRSLQWTLLDEGPPCLPHDSHAYKFAGFGTHEFVIYYDLVRHLIWSLVESRLTESPTSNVQCPTSDSRSQPFNIQSSIQAGVSQGQEGGLAPALLSAGTSGAQTATQVGLSQGQEGGLAPALLRTLDQIKTNWLEQPQPDYDGRIPAILIDNERKRLPEAMRPRDMIIDEDCPMCQMFGDETTPLCMGVGFWHLDGCNMDDDFAFSSYMTREEWEAENRRRDEFNEEFNRKWEERKARQQRLSPGEILEHDPYFDPDPFPDLELDDSSLIFGESVDDNEEFPQ